MSDPWPAPGHTWVLWTSRHHLRADEAVLSPEERARAGRMHGGLGEAWAATRCWVRRELADRAGGDPAEVEVTEGPRGRPAFGHPGLPPDLEANVAHTDGVVVLALGRHRLGVDVEDRPPAGEDLVALAEVVGSPAEVAELAAVEPSARAAAFQRWWVRKEAVLKAEGTGFLADPRRVHVGVTALAPPAPWVVADLGDLPGRAGRDGPALAVATAGPSTVLVTET